MHPTAFASLYRPYGNARMIPIMTYTRSTAAAVVAPPCGAAVISRAHSVMQINRCHNYFLMWYHSPCNYLPSPHASLNKQRPMQAVYINNNFSIYILGSNVLLHAARPSRCATAIFHALNTRPAVLLYIRNCQPIYNNNLCPRCSTALFHELDTRQPYRLNTQFRDYHDHQSPYVYIYQYIRNYVNYSSAHAIIT